MKRLRFGLVYTFEQGGRVHVRSTLFFDYLNPMYIKRFWFVVPCIMLDWSGRRLKLPLPSYREWEGCR